MSKDEELSKINALDKISDEETGCILFFVFIVLVLLMVMIHIHKIKKNEALCDRQVIVTTESKTYSFITNYNKPYNLYDNSINITDKMTGEEITIQSTEMEIKENVIQEQHRIEASQ